MEKKENQHSQTWMHTHWAFISYSQHNSICKHKKKKLNATNHDPPPPYSIRWLLPIEKLISIVNNRDIDYIVEEGASVKERWKKTVEKLSDAGIRFWRTSCYLSQKKGDAAGANMGTPEGGIFLRPKKGRQGQTTWNAWGGIYFRKRRRKKEKKMEVEGEMLEISRMEATSLLDSFV